jgi:hypothetical protein
MSDVRTDATPVIVHPYRPPGWFDVHAVVGDRTLDEIVAIRAELERIFRLAHAVGERWRAANAAVSQCVDATLTRTGGGTPGFDIAFAGWTNAASGLLHLADLGALIARQLDGSLDPLDGLDGFDHFDKTAVQALLDGGGTRT